MFFSLALFFFALRILLLYLTMKIGSSCALGEKQTVHYLYKHSIAITNLSICLGRVVAKCQYHIRSNLKLIGHYRIQLISVSSLKFLGLKLPQNSEIFPRIYSLSLSSLKQNKTKDKINVCRELHFYNTTLKPLLFLI